MRGIIKGLEPPSLTAHRQTANSDYDNYQDKESLRLALVAEQRGICCYCMTRIHVGNDSMKVEHWRCQDKFPTERLNYANLLGACRGGEGLPLRFQHCDTRKCDKDLLWNPAESVHHIETRVRYDADGTIRSDNTVFDAQLNEVLNLNLPLLRNGRKAVYNGILEWLRREKVRIRGPISSERLQRERERYVRGNSNLPPYSPVAVWILEQKLRRLSV